MIGCAACRCREASQITSKLMEHFAEGAALMDLSGDTPLHYATAVGNVAVASAMVMGSAKIENKARTIPQHVSNMTGRWALHRNSTPTIKTLTLLLWDHVLKLSLTAGSMARFLMHFRLAGCPWTWRRPLVYG